MSKRIGPKQLALILLLAGVLAPLPLKASGETYFGLGYMTRSFSAGEADTVYKLKSLMLTAGKRFNLSEGWDLTLEGGLTMANFNGLIFNDLPLSLQIDSGAMPGLVIGARLDKRLWTMDEFVVELETTARASLTLKKSWDLEDLAVDGNAKGTNWWAEASVGPKFSYNFFGSFVPSLKIAASYFTGSYKMDETLEEMTGSQKKTLKGKSYIEAVFSGLYRASSKLTMIGEVGFRPYKGGVDLILNAAARVKF